MSYLEQAKKLLAESEEKREALFCKMMKTYVDDGFDEDEIDIENGIVGDIPIEWYEMRNIYYMDDIVICQEVLVHALTLLERRDKESLHNANKAFETLVNQARRIKKARAEDIQQAQNVIDAMTEIIKICDENRK